MKNFRRILILVLLVIVLIFAWQNSEMAKVDFIAWHWEISEALVIFISFACGLIVGIVAARPR